MLGWYKLRSGQAFYGTIPKDAEALDGPPLVEGPAIPPKSAPKADWVAWAVECGWSPEDAERKSKKALIAELGDVSLIKPRDLAPGEQLVDASEGGDPIGPEVTGVDLGTDLAQGGLVEAGQTFVIGDGGYEPFTMIPKQGGQIVGHGDEG